MKLFILSIVTLLIVANTVSAQLTAQGIKIGEVRDGVTTLTQLTCKAPGPQCSEDCQTLMVCGLTEFPIQNKTCAAINSDKPYCISNTCQAEPSNSSQCALSNAFVCTSIGLFPDPNDCSTYISCLSSGNADINRCPKGYNYDSKQTVCVLANGRNPAASAKCDKVSCPARANFTFISYKPNPAYYVFCSDTQKVMFKCPDEVNQIFDVATQKCQYNCNSAGNFEDRQQCTNYYVCSRQGNKYNTVNLKCPAGYKFEGKKCVIGQCKNAIDDQSGQ